MPALQTVDDVVLLRRPRAPDDLLALAFGLAFGRHIYARRGRARMTGAELLVVLYNADDGPTQTVDVAEHFGISHEVFLANLKRLLSAMPAGSIVVAGDRSELTEPGRVACVKAIRTLRQHMLDAVA